MRRDPPPGRVGEHLRGDEAVLGWTRPAPRSLLGPVIGVGSLLLLAGVLLLVVGIDRARAVGPLLGLVAVFLTGAARSAYARVRAVFFTAYTLTDHRLLASSSLFTRETTSVPLDQVSAIEQRRGPIDALLGLDTLVVSAYGERGTSVAIPGLREVDRLRSELSKAAVATASPRWLLRGD